MQEQDENSKINEYNMIKTIIVKGEAKQEEKKIK